MKSLNAVHPDGESVPDWEIWLRDGFGRPGEAVGGVTGLVHTAGAALNAFLTTFPELARYPLIAVRSTTVAPRSTYDGV